MNEKVFFDSNILIYAYTHAGDKTTTARELLSIGGTVSVQALNETANTLWRKFATGWPRINQILDSILSSCPNPLPLTLETHRAAMRLCERYGFSVYDAMIVASALEADCKTLYTEDLHHGQVIDGLRIENPFRGLATL